MANCINLSAKGSIAFPNSVTILNLLAICPSKKSVKPARRTIPAQI